MTRTLFRDPVFTAAGHTYEREAMETWLQNQRRVADFLAGRSRARAVRDDKCHLDGWRTLVTRLLFETQQRESTLRRLKKPSTFCWRPWCKWISTQKRSRGMHRQGCQSLTCGGDAGTTECASCGQAQGMHKLGCLAWTASLLRVFGRARHHRPELDHRLLLRGSCERCRWRVLRFRRVLGQHLQHHLAQLSWLVLELERG